MTYRLLYSLFALLARLPFGALYVISDVLFVVMHYVVRYRRRVITDNLCAAFPEADDDQIRTWHKAFSRHLCDVIVETVKLLHVSDEEMHRRIEVRGGERVDEIARRGQDIVAFLGHYGNWEWETFVTRFYSPEIHTAHIYKPLHNKAFDRLMIKLRGRFQSEGIAQDQSIRRLLSLHREGRFLVGVIADHRPNVIKEDYTHRFFGRDAAISIGGEVIGNKCGAAFLYLDVEKTSRGHYRLTFMPIEPIDADESFPVTHQYYRMMEQTIRRNPSYWLWSHNRWKKKA